MTHERRIEILLEEYFRSLGWIIDSRGDHLAEWCDHPEPINLTELARKLADELAHA